MTVGGSLSFSLVRLRQLQESFAHLAGGRPTSASAERAARRTAEQLGTTALPLLLRQLTGGPGDLGDSDESRWAHALLHQLATASADLRTRTIDALCDVVGRPSLDDDGKMRALALLTELGVRPPEVTHLRDPDAARERSLGELAGCLTTPAEVARATDVLLREMAPPDVETFVTDLQRTEPVSAARLIDELLVRDDLPGPTRASLRELRGVSLVRSGIVRPEPSRRRSPPRLGRHPDGRRVLVASGRQPGKPPRLRVLCALVSPDGRLIDGHHLDDVPIGGLGREILAPLTRQGFEFAELGLNTARGCLIQAARSALLGGLPLPRDFYLGRDLLDLRDEHLDGTGRLDEIAEVEALAARATDLLRDGEHAEARALLERFVVQAPGNPDGHAHLGLCLLGLGDPMAARRHLGRAAFLCPDEPLHQWNLAAAAHREADLAGCHQALRSYLDGNDLAPMAAARRAHALRFVAEYERLRDLDRRGRDRPAATRSRRRTSSPGRRQRNAPPT